LSTGSYISFVLLGRGGGGKKTGMERVDRVKGGGLGPHPQQAGPKIPSSLNVSKKVAIASLCTL
jgi:hypothetical protein